MNEKTLEKLKILADAAKYDVSCASSGTSRGSAKNGIGTATGWGICHSFTPDGRCISLFKILLTKFQPAEQRRGAFCFHGRRAGGADH